MTNFQITCNYELNPLLREFLGARLSVISGKDCTLGIGNQLTCSGFGELRFSAYFEREEIFLAVLFASMGHESYAGDLYGFELTNFEKGNRKKFLNQEPHPARILSEFGTINKIVSLGEVRNEIVTVKGKEEEIACFFPPNKTLPDTITINKKTLEVIGFLFDTGKWLYLYSNGEGHYSIDLEKTTPPEELCQDQGYLAMEKELHVLNVFV